MDKKPVVVLLLSVAIGFVITSISGLFSTRLSRMGVHVVFRGMPLPWVIQVIPRAGHILWASFVADAVFWVLITFAASALVLYIFTRSQRQANLP